MVAFTRDSDSNCRRLKFRNKTVKSNLSLIRAIRFNFTRSRTLRQKMFTGKQNYPSEKNHLEAITSGPCLVLAPPSGSVLEYLRPFCSSAKRRRARSDRLASTVTKQHPLCYNVTNICVGTVTTGTYLRIHSTILQRKSEEFKKI